MNEHAPRHAAVLLAAGGSRRLGRAKQLLPRDGEPLLRRIATLLHATAPSRLCVVTGARRASVLEALDGITFDEVHHAAWADGLAGSVRAAALALRAHDGPVLVVACDQPALDAAVLDAMLAAAAGGTGFAAVAHGDMPGVPVVVPGAWFARFGEASTAATAAPGAARGDATALHDRGLGQALRGLPPGTVALVDAPDLAFDLDTDADVATAIARGWLDADAVRVPPADPGIER